MAGEGIVKGYFYTDRYFLQCIICRAAGKAPRMAENWGKALGMQVQASINQTRKCCCKAESCTAEKRVNVVSGWVGYQPPVSGRATWREWFPPPARGPCGERRRRPARTCPAARRSDSG